MNLPSKTELQDFSISLSQETIPTARSPSELAQADAGQDVIIRELLKNRPKMTDVTLEDESERQKRMYNMLRHSSHYKRLQVKIANNHWEEEQSNLSGILNSLDMDEATRSCSNFIIPDTEEPPRTKRGRAVTFSMDLTKQEPEKSVARLPKDIQRSKLQQLMGRIKSVIF